MKLLQFVSLILFDNRQYKLGLIGIVDVNLVKICFGDYLLSKMIYSLVGLSGIYLIFYTFKDSKFQGLVVSKIYNFLRKNLVCFLFITSPFSLKNTFKVITAKNNYHITKYTCILRIVILLHMVKVYHGELLYPSHQYSKSHP